MKRSTASPAAICSLSSAHGEPIGRRPCGTCLPAAARVPQDELRDAIALIERALAVT